MGFFSTGVLSMLCTFIGITNSRSSAVTHGVADSARTTAQQRAANSENDSLHISLLSFHKLMSVLYHKAADKHTTKPPEFA